MLGNQFYDKTCTISSVAIVDDGVSQTPQETVLYDTIPCSFWRAGAGEDLKDTELSRNTDQSNYQISLKPEYDQVREGMEIELFETYGSLGKFKVNFVEVYDRISGLEDHIYLSCTRDGN